MRPLAVVSVLLAIIASAQAASNCTSINALVTSDWCDSNCGHDPSYCPPAFCSCATGAVSPNLTCSALSSTATAAWCDAVCNHNPPSCPPDLCSCAAVSPTPLPSTSSCHAIQAPATDVWCTNNCAAGYCPSLFCQCGSGSVTQYVVRDSCVPVVTTTWCQQVCPAAPTSSDCTVCCTAAPAATPGPAITLQKPQGSSDPSNTKLYYSTSQALNAVSVNALTGAVLSTSTCATGFVGLQGIAVDSDEGVFVADFGASQVLYVNPVCGNVTVVIPYGHAIANPIDVEISDQRGTILVSSSSPAAVYEVTLDANHRVVSWTKLNTTNQLATGIAECQDTEGHGGFLYVSQNAYLNFYDGYTDSSTTIVTPAFGANDISDVEYRPGCGIFFAASDKNMVYQCYNASEAWSSCTPSVSNCRPICNNLVDSSSCAGLMAPTGLTIDCYCNVFTTNLGNGNLVEFSEPSRSPSPSPSATASASASSSISVSTSVAPTDFGKKDGASLLKAFTIERVSSGSFFGQDIDIVGSNWCVGTPAQSPSPTPSISTPSSGCFSGDTMVTRLNSDSSVSVVSMSQLAIGDRVSCVQYDGSYDYCSIYMFDTINTNWARLLRLSTNTRHLDMTTMHNVYTLNGVNPSSTFAAMPMTGLYVMAKDVQLGDQLVIWNADAAHYEIDIVTSISFVDNPTGVFDPQVLGNNRDGGRIIVNGIVASHNTGSTCVGPDSNQVHLMLLSVQHWYQFGATSLGYGVAAVDIPATLWGSATATRDPWASQVAKAIVTNRAQGKQPDWNSISTIVHGWLDNGTVLTDALVKSMMNSNFI